MKPGPLSFVYFARDSARRAARKARARALVQPRPNETQRHAERRWEGEGGNHPTRRER